MKPERRTTKARKWLTAFVPHRLELMISPPWQLAPRPLRRMLERLEIEHLRHGGLNNGELYVSFGQFVEAGISRRSIKPLQMLGERLGLLEVFQSDESGRRDVRPPNAYRLTYVPSKGKDKPTDEWRSITDAQAQAWIEAFQKEETAARTATGKTVRKVAA